jgi:hypothetical protein
VRGPGEGKIRQVQGQRIQNFPQRGAAKNESEDTGVRGSRGWLRIERETTHEKPLDGSALSRTTNSPQRRKVEFKPRLHGAVGAGSRSEAG